MLTNSDIGVTQIAHRLDVSPATLYLHPHREPRMPRAFENGALSQRPQAAAGGVSLNVDNG